MGKFERKSKAERQAEIQQAARQVFLAKGYRNTTMEDIIAGTSLSKGGVYKYYQSPKEVLMDIMRQGNQLRLMKIKELEQMMASENSISEVMVALALNKIFDETPDKKLYVMFLSEMIYDKEIEALYYQIEAEGKAQILQIVGRRLGNKIEKISYQDYLMISRVISALIIGDQLFQEQRVLLERKEKIGQMLRTMFDDLEVN